jgi:transcription elongation factor Elf1
MKLNSGDCVACSECGYEIAAIILNGKGKRALRTYDQVELTIIDKEKNVGSIKCPKCGGKTQTNLEFWRQF